MLRDDQASRPPVLTTPARNAQLVLADGTLLRGESFGARGLAIGEVVFNTGMTGYQEVMTDPSYAGQLVVFTYPELGNTGVNAADQEADRCIGVEPADAGHTDPREASISGGGGHIDGIEAAGGHGGSESSWRRCVMAAGSAAAQSATAAPAG